MKWNSECIRFVELVLSESGLADSDLLSEIRYAEVHDCRGLLRGTLGCYAWL